MIHLSKFKRGPRVCKYNCWRVLKDDTNAKVTHIHVVNNFGIHIVHRQRGMQYISASFRLNGYFYASESSPTPEGILERLTVRIIRRLRPDVYPFPFEAYRLGADPDPGPPPNPQPPDYEYWAAGHVIDEIVNNAVRRLGD